MTDRPACHLETEDSVRECRDFCNLLFMFSEKIDSLTLKEIFIIKGSLFNVLEESRILRYLQNVHKCHELCLLLEQNSILFHRTDNCS